MASPIQFESLKKRKILITGASSGIGKATAYMFTGQQAEVFLTARRKEKLIELKEELLRKDPEIKVNLCPGDINDPNHRNKLSTLNIDILINNAGLALGKDYVEDSKLEDWQTMIQTNLTSAIDMIRLLTPHMLEKGIGDIVSVCSIAGHESYAGGAVYCATKSALRSFHQSLRKETYGKNLRAMLISPGLVETPFSEVRFKGDKKKAISVYEKTKPLRPEDIAEQIFFMITRPRHVSMDEVVTLATAQGAATTIKYED